MKTVYLNEDLTTGAANGTSWADAYRTWAAFLTGEQGTLSDNVTVNVRSTGVVSASRSLLSASWVLGAYQLRFVGDSDCRLYYNSTTVRVMRMQLSGVIFERITTRGGNYGWEVTGANNTFRNCRAFGATNRGFAISTGAGNVCQNCEAAAGEYGFHFGVVTGTVINCAAGGTSIADYYGTGTFTKTTSASEDTTGSTGLQSVAFTTANYTNVTPGSENLKPVDGGAAQGVGTDMSATYTTDYNGATRILWSVAATAADADLVLVTYNVTYDGNTNTGGTVPVDANDYAEGATVTIATNSGTLVKTDFTFNGWNTAADGSGTARTPGETFLMPGADVTLYAQWASSTGETFKYVRKGASGTGSGDDWTNAYDEPPATLSRDVVYLFADTGATPHAAYTINDAVDGVKYIEFRKATAAAHGTNTGWSSSYGDGVTQFTQIVPATSYIKINGVVGGGYGSFTTGHGFRIYSTSANRRVYFSGNALTHVQLEHIDIEGLGYHAANAGEDGIHAINGITTAGPANVIINNCYVHDFTYGGQLIQTDRCDT